MMVEEAQPRIVDELSPSNLVSRVLSELPPQEEVDESESGGGKSPTMLLLWFLREMLGKVDQWMS